MVRFAKIHDEFPDLRTQMLGIRLIQNTIMFFQ